MLYLKKNLPKSFKKFESLDIHSADIIRYFGKDKGLKLLQSMKDFLSSAESDLDPILLRNQRDVNSHNNLSNEDYSIGSGSGRAIIMDSLRAGYKALIKKNHTRVGVHFTMSTHEMLSSSNDINEHVLTQFLDEECDDGFLVPSTENQDGIVSRKYRSGEPDETDWKRTTYIIPMAIDALKRGQSENKEGVGAMELMKLLANFCFDFPRYANQSVTNLHCLAPEPRHWGTLVFAQHRTRAPRPMEIYFPECLGHRYEVKSGRTKTFFLKDNSFEKIAEVFSDQTEPSLSFIKDYFRFMSVIRQEIDGMDILIALSLCRNHEWFYTHLMFNIEHWAAHYGRFLDAFENSSNRYEGNAENELTSSGTESHSASEKIRYLSEFREWLQKIQAIVNNDPLSYEQIFNLINRHIDLEPTNIQKKRLELARKIVYCNRALTGITLLKFKSNFTQAQVNNLMKKAPLAFQNLNIDEDLDELLKLPVNQFLSRIRKHFDKICSHIWTLPRPMELENVGRAEYYKRLAENKAHLLAQKNSWDKAVVVVTDLTDFSQKGDATREATAQFYQCADNAFRNYGGLPLTSSPGGDDKLWWLFETPNHAITACIGFQENLQDQHYRGIDNPLTLECKIGIANANLNSDAPNDSMTMAMAFAVDCCEIETSSYRNRADIIVPETFIQLLKSEYTELYDLFEKIESCFIRRGEREFSIYKYVGEKSRLPKEYEEL